MDKVKLSMQEKECRRKFFRVRIVLSLFMTTFGVIFLLLGYAGILPFDILTILFVSGGMIVFGLLISLTLFRCPYCGERINIRGLIFKYFYSCPHCDFRADGENIDGKA